MSFRSPEYIERYEYTPIELTTPLETNLRNNQQQRRTGLEFQVNDLSRPIDWYNSYVKIGFLVNQLANGENYVNSPNAIAPCCGVQSFVKNLSVKANGAQVYNGTMLSVGLFVKNLLTFSKGYAETIAKNMFWYLDDEDQPNAMLNKAFKFRNMAILGGETVHAQLPLNYFSFFDSLNDKILPPLQMNLIFDLETDNNILWHADRIPATAGEGNVAIPEVPRVPDGRVIVTNFTLWIKRVNFNGIGLEKVAKEFFKTYMWPYQTELVQRSHLQTQHRGEWQIMSAFKPRHVFVWFSNAKRDDDQLKILFMFDLYKLVSCQLFVGNGDSYPECRYEMANKDRILRHAIEYAIGNNYFDTSTQLTPWLWEHRYPLYYFDLTYHRSMLDSSAQTLKFVWDLSENPGTSYYINALLLQEQKATYDARTNKLTVD